MVVRNSLLSAMCVAGLLGVVAVHPAAAITNTIDVSPAIQIVTGPTTSVTVTSFTDATYTSGLTLTGTWPFPVIGSLPTYTGSGLFVHVITFDTSVCPPGTYTGNFSFTSAAAPLTGGANQDFAFICPATVVPEPGAVAFGILAAGSTVYLIARKRKAA